MSTTPSDTERGAIHTRRLSGGSGVWHGLLLVLLSLFILPGVPVLRGGELKVRLDDLIIIAWGLGLWLGRATKWTLTIGQVDILYFSLAGSTLISTLYGWALSGVIEIRDLLELVKLAKYWCAYQLAVSLRPPIDVFYKSAYLSSIIICLFSVAQVFDLFAVNSWLSPLYISPSQVNHLDPGRAWYQRRATATLGNPNSLAAMLVIIFWLLWMSPRLQRPKVRWIALACALVSLVLTQSRTGMVAFLMGWAGYLVLGQVSLLRRFWGALIPILLVIVGFSGVLPYLAGLKGGLEVNSLQLRIKIWNSILNETIKSPILGFGPAKTLLHVYVDNEYLLYLYRYGIVGLSLLVLLYISIGCSSYKKRNTPYGVVFWILLGLLVVNLTNTTFYNLQLMPILMLLVGGLRVYGKNFTYR